jgi:hypothetical protein
MAATIFRKLPGRWFLGKTGEAKKNCRVDLQMRRKKERRNRQKLTAADCKREVRTVCRRTQLLFRQWLVYDDLHEALVYSLQGFAQRGLELSKIDWIEMEHPRGS